MSCVQRAAVAKQLFPAGVAAFEIHGEASPFELLLSERECVTRSVEERVREFAAGRLCARAALAALGLEPTPLLRGKDRAPLWPSGVVGSITHTTQYCLAVAGSRSHFAALGVDAERVDQSDPSLWSVILRAEELALLHDLEESVRGRNATIIFSAKEAFYKFQYELTRSWLGFEDVLVELNDDTFQLRVLDEAHPIRQLASRWAGRFSVEGPIVITAIAAEHQHPLRVA